MADDKDRTRQSGSGAHPGWWTEVVSSSWKQVSERAVTFGHGARQAYENLGVWTEALEEQLKADWKAAGLEAESAWEQVREAVKLGWGRARHAVAEATTRTADHARDAARAAAEDLKDSARTAAEELKEPAHPPTT
jgi:3-oxoacyl-ACP reductase-like protein